MCMEPFLQLNANFFLKDHKYPKMWLNYELQAWSRGSGVDLRLWVTWKKDSVFIKVSHISLILGSKISFVQRIVEPYRKRVLN